MTSQYIEAIERDVATATTIVNLGNTLERLKKNKDFNTVIVKGFFEQEAIRLVHLKADPSMQSKEAQDSIIAQMDAIGGLSSYLDTIILRANMARRTLEDSADQLAELYAAGDEE
jgi:hypothetical protein